ncbi:ArdC-like ssDNA-binding domain-containing protein [Natronosalvus halobius]|uniref:ArdC-like ssDNA-binding domain-containing protein n=1 Tax=Natronosalvus halobius TaxID=2953746 RepID=UPI00209CA35F|nr:ArdC-like ssDNA-binding domain-containing protein [Natronosalvus halobius]USZ71445.1 ArdC-like ssDNA-binding domain-containing protein [Natronosalvus halobius]
MATKQPTVASFEETETRHDEMNETIESWLSDLVDLISEARASEEFKHWLEVQSRFHDYSHRNTLLIAQQCPSATRVAGYRSWQTNFDRQVKKGERAIWIWAPITARKCPSCGLSKSRHSSTGCEYTETPPEEWSKGLVGFKPVPVFDISQTEGEALPSLETETTGDAREIVPLLYEAGKALDIEVTIVATEAWPFGSARGVCEFHRDRRPTVKVRERTNTADLATTLVHEYAHVLLHADGLSKSEHASREVEAEAVAYIVGRYVGLDTSGSAFYLAAWQGDEPETVSERFERIRSSAHIVIKQLESIE